MLMLRAVIFTAWMFTGTLTNAALVFQDLNAGHEEGRSFLWRRADMRLMRHSTAHAVAKESHENGSLQLPGKVERTSWFNRLGNGVWSVIGGFCMIPFSMVFLWVNEQRNARQESLIILGEQEVKIVDPTSAEDLREDGVLVHMNSVIAKGVATLADERFTDVKMQSGWLRLRTHVEACQWQEHVEKETRKDRLGGGETTMITYRYTKGWHACSIDSSGFHLLGYENPSRLRGLQPGIENKCNAVVMYGEHHYLPQDLVQCLDGFQDASSSIGETVTCNKKSFAQVPQDDSGWYYRNPNASADPKIGDLRVAFRYVPDGPVTVLALQAKDSELAGKFTFLPYRTVSRGFWCGRASSEQLQSRLLEQGRKSTEEVCEDSTWETGPFFCLCCCCNLASKLVSAIFATVAPPHIYFAFHGVWSKHETFSRVKLMSLRQKWGFRFLGWLLLFIGTCALFEPLLVIVDILPLLGPYISHGASWVVGFVCFAVTATLATLVVSLAFLRYHPVIGLYYLSLAAMGARIMIWAASHSFVN